MRTIAAAAGVWTGRELDGAAYVEGLRVRWHPVDEDVSEIAGNLGRQWLPSHRGTDTADLVVAATTINLGSRLLTRNVRHFPMFEGLAPPN